MGLWKKMKMSIFSVLRSKFFSWDQAYTKLKQVVIRQGAYIFNVIVWMCDAWLLRQRNAPPVSAGASCTKLGDRPALLDSGIAGQFNKREAGSPGCFSIQWGKDKGYHSWPDTFMIQPKMRCNRMAIKRLWELSVSVKYWKNQLIQLLNYYYTHKMYFRCKVTTQWRYSYNSISISPVCTLI